MVIPKFNRSHSILGSKYVRPTSTPVVDMVDIGAGGGRFVDGGAGEQEVKLANYLRPREVIDADLCISQNIRSVNANFGKLEDFILRHHNIKICALQEVWTIDIPVKLAGFHPLISKQRAGKRGGGVGFFLDESIKFKIIPSPFIEGVFETMCVELQLGKCKTIQILNIYRPPDPTLIPEFLRHLSDYKLSDKHNNIILGDLNIDIANIGAQGLIETLADRGLASIIDIPTRVKDGSSTIIDHIYTDIKITRPYVYETDMTDHYTTCMTLNDKKTKTRFLQEKYSHPLHDERSLNYLKAYLQAIQKSSNWEEVTSCNTPEAFNIFSNILKEAIDICCPTTIKTRNTIPKNPWMTTPLLKLRAKKEKLHRKARQKNTEEAWAKFKEFSKAYNKECRNTKNLYYNEKFNEAKNDGRKLWQIANEVTGRPSKKGGKSKVGPIEGSKTDLESATKINHFFATVAPTLKAKIKKSKKSFKDFLPKKKAHPSLQLRTVSKDKIEDIIDKMRSKTSFSHDTMSNKMLKHIKDEISLPLTHVINISIIHNFVPDDWKKAKMCPIFKKGDPSLPTNYRPISLLPTMSKVLERVISNQVYGFLERNKLIHPHQFGYRYGHSCEGLLLKVLDYVAKERDKGKHVLNVYIDLTKAFDTVPWEIMFHKLRHYGLPVSWFQSYLSNRKMYTRVADSDSSVEDILCGVPQGSILGPLLFILFIGDLPYATKFFTALYCDDTTFGHSHENMDTLFKETNKMLEEVEEWFNSNFLSLHPGKTRYMLFSSKNTDQKLYLLGNEVERVHENGKEQSFKLVGVHLDENLSFKYHIKHVQNKVIGMSSLIRRSKNNLPSKIRKMLFHSLVQSHISYCLPIWGGALKTHLDPLRISQKKAARVACNVKRNKHSDPIFNNLGAMKLDDMYRLSCAKIAAKTVSGFQVDGIQDCFTTMRTNNVDSKGPKTRQQSSDNLVKPFYMKPQLISLPAYQIPRIWNEDIPKPIRSKGITPPNSALNPNFKAKTVLNALENSFKAQTLQEYGNYTCGKRNCFSCNA